MQEEVNKAIVRRAFDEFFNEGNLDLANALFDENYISHNAPPGIPPGPEGVKLLLTAYRTAFPDLQFTAEQMIAEGDKVAQRWTMRGTHQGELMGIPPTGKQVVVTGIEIDRLVNGKIAENWLIFDQMGLMQQLGVIPAPGEGGT